MLRSNCALSTRRVICREIAREEPFRRQAHLLLGTTEIFNIVPHALQAAVRHLTLRRNEGYAAKPVRMRKCHFVGDHAAQGFADVMRLLDAELVPETKNILREIGNGHFLDTAKSRPAMTAQVQRQNAKPVSNAGTCPAQVSSVNDCPGTKVSAGASSAVQVIGFETVHFDLRHSMFLWAVIGIVGRPCFVNLVAKRTKAWKRMSGALGLNLLPERIQERRDTQCGLFWLRNHRVREPEADGMSEPEMGPKQVRIARKRQDSFALSLMVSGWYGKPLLPFVPAAEVAGIVMDVAEG